MFISKFIKNLKKKKKKKKDSIRRIEQKLIELEYQSKYSNIAERLDAHKNLYQKYLNKEPILTFCMPTYNGEKYIARALESILMQETSYLYKIWIIDDCSTDNTANIVREYQKLYPNIIDLEVNEHNEGGKTMAPKIFNKVSTKYWMNFDQDDYWLSKDRMQRALDYFENHPDCTLFASNIIVKASNKLSIAYSGNESYIDFEFKDYPLPLNILMQTSSAMYRNVFTKEDLDHINSYVKTPKEHCILGDTFRNVFALSKGKGHYENSIDSVYNWTENGVWSRLNVAQQDFYNLQYFYDSIDFFKNKLLSEHMKHVAIIYLEKTKKNKNMLNKDELKEFSEIERNLKGEGHV